MQLSKGFLQACVESPITRVLRFALRALVSSWLILLFAVIAPTAAHAKPNILVILADDLGYGDLSCYGAKDMRTPNIDRLIGSGMRFDYFRANSCVCSPSRAALLTGRYPDLVGVPGVIRTERDDNWGYLSPQAVLLPKLLKPAGYTSALIGKWHLGLTSPNTPNERGFDLFHGFLGDMMDDYYTHLRGGRNFMRLNTETIDPKGHATDIFTTWACDYLRERSKAKEPFFLYLAYNAPHMPTQPPKEWLDRVTQREPGITPKRARLVALIEHLDSGIAQVMATLKETGLDSNTLVIFNSDNGGDLNAGATNGVTRDGKGTMYEGGLRVPFAAVWPGHIQPNTRSNAAALTMDIFATALDAAGAKSPRPVEAVSLLPILLGQSQQLPQRDLFFTRREGGNAFAGKTIDAILRGDWKLLQNTPFKPMELYDLKNDPLEKTDMAQQRRKIFNDLSAELRRQVQRGGQIPWQAPS